MKDNPHLQQDDLPIWLALKYKFERLHVSDTSCRPSAVRLRDQDDPYDDAHPEGENSAKRKVDNNARIAVRNIFKYLRKTKDRFLVYGGEEELGMTGYYDANWQTHKDDSRSQSGWLFLLNRGAVTWKSLKQATVADFTCNSEYIAACEASKEAIWMKNFFEDLGFVPTVQDPIEIFCDNENAVALTKEPKDHGKSKNIERKYHFVRSKVEEGT
ncbi:hypothetical protein Tco_0144419 [Tanacetum coccineum]